MKLELTHQEIDLIGKALSFLPYGEVYLLIEKIKKQITDVE